MSNVISKIFSSITPCTCGENHKIEGGKRGANLVFYITGIALVALAALVLSGVFPNLAINLGITGVKVLGGTFVAGGGIFLIIAAFIHRSSFKQLA